MRIHVKVQPKSSRQRVERLADGSLKVWLQSAPRGGKANAELVGVLAEFFKIRKSAVRLVSGAKSRIKTVEVTV